MLTDSESTSFSRLFLFKSVNFLVELLTTCKTGVAWNGGPMRSARRSRPPAHPLLRGEGSGTAEGRDPRAATKTRRATDRRFECNARCLPLRRLGVPGARRVLGLSHGGGAGGTPAWGWGWCPGGVKRGRGWGAGLPGPLRFANAAIGLSPSAQG